MIYSRYFSTGMENGLIDQSRWAYRFGVFHKGMMIWE
jgi:hypothetical protein